MVEEHDTNDNEEDDVKVTVDFEGESVTMIRHGYPSAFVPFWALPMWQDLHQSLMKRVDEAEDDA